MSVVIIDYQTGNLRSIWNMLKRIGVGSEITNNRETISKATKLILPGVGSFDHGVSKLQELGLFDLLKEKILEKQTPVLGICLGMQLLGKGSEEGTKEGLNIVDFYSRKFDFSFQESSHLKIPHMGWNEVFVHNRSKLFNNISEPPQFYFVHSYHFPKSDNQEVIGTTHFGYDFTSAIEKRNILGVQFHPEKSHKYGMTMLKNFVEFY